MANLFNVLDHEVSDDVIGKIGAYLNEPPVRTKDGLAKAVPAILCALHQKMATTADQNDVFGMLQRGGFDARPRDNLATIASSPGGLADLAKVGGPLLATLFGARQSPLIDWFASAAGLSKSAATSLLALAVPMVLSVIGRLTASTGTFDVASVTRLIRDQGVALGSASPAGLAQALGVSQCGEAPVRVQPAAARSGPWWWLLPLLLLVLLALLFFAWRSCQQEPVREAVAPPAPAVSFSAAPASVKQDECATLTWSSTNASSVSIEPGVGKVDPNGSKQVCPASTTQYTISVAGEGGSRTAATTVSVAALAPKVMTFSEAALFEFGKSNLKPEGREKIKEYYKQAKEELGRAGKAIITGYTDNVGKSDYNLTLSLQRAEAVRDYLISLGADPNKFQVSGAGETNPIADNSTEEGRAKNRRVEVEVIGVER
jgi:outer membrane protein OmpA-like peptidoglycan-associated protein